MRKTVGLNCINFNARGLTRKVDELRTWIGSCDWDIIAITETRLGEGQDCEIHVPEYRGCRWRKERRGIYIFA